MSLQVKIIGSSHAGANVAYNLRRDGFEGDIEIISTESFPPYHRPPLSKDFLKGKTEKEKLTFKPEAFYVDNQITLTLLILKFFPLTELLKLLKLWKALQLMIS